MDVYARKKDRSHCKISPPDKARIKWCLENNPRTAWIPREPKVLFPIQAELSEVKQIDFWVIDLRLQAKHNYIQKRINYWRNHPNKIIKTVCEDNYFLRMLIEDDIRRLFKDKNSKKMKSLFLFEI